MDDPIRSHPTREEQLDVFTNIIADAYQTNDRALDLGCGTGYVANMLFERCPSMHITGVDLSADALEQASERFGNERFTAVQADLTDPQAIAGAEGRFRFIYSCLTFHDLTDPQKQALLAWASAHLAPDGWLLVYDRLRLDAEALFPAQQSMWRRIERIHGRGMRTADSFQAYQTDLGSDNAPARLADYLTWFDALGMESACLHLHGNVALLGAAPRG